MKRRDLLGTGVKAGAMALIPLVDACTSTPKQALPSVMTPLGYDNDKVLTAIANRIVPPDELGPGAGDAGATHYINHSLAEWNQGDLPLLRTGLTAINEVAFKRHSIEFASLTPAQQDGILTELEMDQLLQVPNGAVLFNRLYRLILEGLLSDPYYGGNRAFIGWDLIGYPGAVLVSTPEMQKMRVRMEPLHTSGYGAEHDGH
ncbi:MAG TPA: gluconate 2-dehydrogenase subunit 3 family protein [Candidatus Acidoferrum sp.]|nr:gluconate 2-dehydrogenase subunit 3 family protein [Candidatus Acidoferrum sp.]